MTLVVGLVCLALGFVLGMYYTYYSRFDDTEDITSQVERLKKSDDKLKAAVDAAPTTLRRKK